MVWMYFIVEVYLSPIRLGGGGCEVMVKSFADERWIEFRVGGGMSWKNWLKRVGERTGP